MDHTVSRVIVVSANRRHSTQGHRPAQCVIALGILVLAVSLDVKGDETWIRHSSFEDFAAGTPEDGGTNLFVSRDGTLQMIHRWDFNNDGYLDLWVGQDHNAVEDVDAFIYRGGATGPRSILPPLRRRRASDCGRTLRSSRCSSP